MASECCKCDEGACVSLKCCYGHAVQILKVHPDDLVKMADAVDNPPVSKPCDPRDVHIGPVLFSSVTLPADPQGKRDAWQCRHCGEVLA